MIDGKASRAVRSQLRNLDSLRLIDKVGTIDALHTKSRSQGEP